MARMQPKPQSPRFLVLEGYDMEDDIRQKNIQSMQQFKDIINEEAAEMDVSRVVRVCQNFRRRVEICYQKKDAFFESGK